VGLLAAAWQAPGRLLEPDSMDYLRLSDSLAGSAQFNQHDRPEVFRTPGYPAFLLLSIPFGPSWCRANALLQIAIDLALVYLTYLLGWMLVDQRTGLLAAAFQAVSAVAAVSSVRVLSDGLFAFLLTLAVLLAVHHLKTGRWWSLLWAAGVLGVSCYVRPVGLAFGAVLAVVLLFRPKRFRRVVVLAGILVVLIVPWIIRNGLRADYWGFSSFVSESMYAFSAPQTIARAEGLSEQEGGQRLRHIRMEISPRPETVGQEVRAKRQAVLQVLQDHPLTYAQIHARGTLGFFLPGATDALQILGLTSGQRGTLAVLRNRGLRAAAKHYFGNNGWAIVCAAPLVGILLIKYVGVLLGLVARGRFRFRAETWLLILLVVAAAVLPGPANHPRFRVPVAPFLGVAAAVGWARLVEWFRPRRSG